jgi:diaminopimelate epimerase
MFNADGSEAEMCGNGIRCVAKFVYDHGLVRKPLLTIETGRGVLKLELEIAGGVVKQVRVDMGEPILEPAKIPTTLSGERVVSVSIPIPDDARCPGWFDECGLDPRITCVSMGNPHAILYCRHVSKVPLEIIGPMIETHKAFPRRTNVHFVEVHSPGEVTMRTWERGSGITLACGTGACSVAVAGVLGGRTQRRLLAHLPGGDLQLEWSETDNHVYMKGPATEVFNGEWQE